MDFKRDLPGSTDRDRNELRADVTSFANAGGGDLIFGVDEAGGLATAVPGLPGVDADAEIRRIESVIQTGIDPRVPGFESRAIQIPGKGAVIVVRAPKSWRGPHLVKINDTFRMFGRNSKGKYPFDATEIRSAFALSEELPERIQRWRDDRLAKVIGGDTPVPIEGSARLIIHLLPLSSFGGNVEFSAGELGKQKLTFHPPGASSFDYRINIDGVLTFSGSQGEPRRHEAYCQIFRSGRVEVVSTEMVEVREAGPTLWSGWLERTLIESSASYLRGMKDLGVQLPIVVLVALSGVKDALFAVDPSLGRRTRTIDRDLVILPDVLVDTYGLDMATVLRPICDAVWNSAGWERSLYYDENGKWNGPR